MNPTDSGQFCTWIAKLSRRAFSSSQAIAPYWSNGESGARVGAAARVEKPNDSESKSVAISIFISAGHDSNDYDENREILSTSRIESRSDRGKTMIRKLKSGKYRLYSRKKDPKTGKRKNLGTFDTREAAQKHERAVQYFKRGG
jgi:hypothetical protein